VSRAPASCRGTRAARRFQNVLHRAIRKAIQPGNAGAAGQALRHHVEAARMRKAVRAPARAK
jgi:DNA-binding FadR family transcriptional regulator